MDAWGTGWSVSDVHVSGVQGREREPQGCCSIRQLLVMGSKVLASVSVCV